MAASGFVVPYPDLSVLLGGGGPASTSAAVAAAPSGKLEVTEVVEADGDVGYLAEIIIVADRHVVAIGGTYSQPTVLVSSNARDFVRRKGLSTGLRAVTHHAGALYEVGEYGLFASSTDLGTTWTKIDTDTEDCLFGMTVLGSDLWLCGDSGYCAKYASGALTKLELGLDDRISDIVAVGGQLYLLGFDGYLRILAGDGTKVFEVEVSDDGPLCGMCRTKSGGFVLVGDGGFIARSDDGRAWKKMEVEDAEVDLESAATLADGRIVIVGDEGKILVSADDGWTWNAIDGLDDSVHLWCVTPFGAGALIGADDGAIWKLAGKGDKLWADRSNEFEGEVYAGDDDDSDDDDDDEDDDDEDDDESDDDESDDDSDEDTASATPGGGGSAEGNANLSRSVDELELSVRTANCLQNARIQWIGELVQKTEADLLRGGNFGAKSLAELREVLGEMDLSLGMTVGSWAAPGGAGDKTVMLVASGANKIAVIKVVREVTGLGLKESLDLVQAAPTRVKAGVGQGEAQAIATALQQAGAEVEIN